MRYDRYDVVIVGSINVDLVVTVDRHPHPGETLLGGTSQYLAGGKGANQAVAAARLGARTAIVGAVGDDSLAATAVEHLRGAAVDLSAMREVSAPTGLAVITLAADGENTIVVVPGANATVSPEAVQEAAGVVAAAAVLVVQAEIPLESVREAVRLAREAGVRAVVNVAPAAVLPWETLRAADPLVVNEHEAAILLAGLGEENEAGRDTAGDGPGRVTTGDEAGQPAAGDDEAADDDAAIATVRAAARRFRARGVPSVVVTLGGAGSLVVDDTGEHAVAARRVAVTDTTGAGDAFVGAMAFALARGASLADAADHASRVAAYSVQRLGAQASYPGRDDRLP